MAKKGAGNKKRNKSTKSEVDRRVQLVKEMLAKGMLRSQIIQHISKNSEIKVSDRQIDNYIKEATELLKIDFEESSNRERLISLVFRRTETIFHMAEDIEDLQTMRGALRDLRDMMGLDMAQKSDITINDGLSSKSDEELDKLLMTLRKQNGA